MNPKRIQRKRTKGWRMPPNTVYVGRPSNWGNPFKVGSAVSDIEVIETKEEAVKFFEAYLDEIFRGQEYMELKGKNLACWCPLDQPCHADVLLEVANE